MGRIVLQLLRRGSESQLALEDVEGLVEPHLPHVGVALEPGGGAVQAAVPRYRR